MKNMKKSKNRPKKDPKVGTLPSPQKHKGPKNGQKSIKLSILKKNNLINK